MRDRCQRWPTLSCWKTVLLMIWNDLWQDFVDIKAIVIFCNRLWLCVALADGHSEHSLNTEWALGSWHSSLKHLNHLWKAVQSLICCSWIFNAQLHVHLKNWTLKFNLLYLLNHIICFSEIYRICCMNAHIQILKVQLKSVLLLLKYKIFL